MAGIRRQRVGPRFQYWQGGRPAPADARARADALAIPPAWTDVWISPHPTARVQATGKDARGRTQYIYHQAWQRRRQQRKFDHLAAFGAALPSLRARVRRDLRRPGLPREKVVAAVVRVLDLAAIRVGSRRYARDNRSYGATTLHAQHARVDHGTVRFRFPGKGGRSHEVEIEDEAVAAVVRACQRLPGRRLFEYRDGQSVAAVGARLVNAYLGEFTSKDFRTWAASVRVLDGLVAAGSPPARRARQRVVRDVLADVAAQLHHTPATCKKSYVHPRILEAYLDGELEERVALVPRRRGLRVAERRLMALIA